MLESTYQARVIRRLNATFPGCVILKNDSSYLQGIPDLLVLHGPKWAALEVKKSDHEPEQPNQVYYVDQLHNMSYASFIFPENEDEVFCDLQQALSPRRSARLSQR